MLPKKFNGLVRPYNYDNRIFLTPIGEKWSKSITPGWFLYKKCPNVFLRVGVGGGCCTLWLRREGFWLAVCVWSQHGIAKSLEKPCEFGLGRIGGGHFKMEPRHRRPKNLASHLSKNGSWCRMHAKCCRIIWPRPWNRKYGFGAKFLKEIENLQIL